MNSEHLLLSGLYPSLPPPLPELVDGCFLLPGLFLSLSPPPPELWMNALFSLCLILHLNLRMNAFLSLVCFSLSVFFST
jgi:hypothetical protein